MKAVTVDDALVAIGAAIVESVRSAGREGVPGGHIYAVVMTHLTLQGFEEMMGRLVQAKLLRKCGQCYYSAEFK